MHLPLPLPLAHLSGFEENEDEELQVQLQGANSGSQHSHEDEEGSQSHNSQGSKEGSGGSAPGGDGKPPKDLPCPRCQSMNTKFCYYNNYSVNQPRHFCRNCQRYWTVGGTLRNVPVGGGSRKKSRTRSRSDPYYRPGGSGSPAPTGSEGDSDGHHSMAMAGAMAADMAPLDGGAFDGSAGFPDFPFHPSQMATFLQLAMHQTAPGMGMNPFPTFPTSTEEEAELQAFYEASQTGFLGSAAAMMSAGLFLPELEPSHLALMHKATLWAEAQRLQTMARRQTAAAAWAAEERESKPSVGMHPLPQQQPQQRSASAAMEAELRHRQQAAHRRPGFWETALMHSRPSSKGAAAAAAATTRMPPGSSSSQQTPWDAETKPLVENDPHSLEEENSNRAAAAAAAAAAYSQGYVDETTTSWGGSGGLNGTPEMYY